MIVPRAQRCCGALSEHAGREPEALERARRLIDVFEDADVDAIVVNVAGCGSTMKEYGRLLRDDPRYAERAAAFSAKVRDISEVLADLEPVAPRHPIEARVAYHDACHLGHGQRVRLQPRAVLRTIPGLEVTDIPEAEICCGSAGIYNMVQPDAGAELGRRKIANVMSVGAGRGGHRQSRMPPADTAVPARARAAVPPHSARRRVDPGSRPYPGPRAARRCKLRRADAGTGPVLTPSARSWPMRVVVAPDKFKGSLTAVEAAEAIGEGLRQGRPGVDVVLAPVADGGDGTVDAAVAAGYDRVTTTVAGPTGEPVTASFAVSGDTAVVEMAEASGLRRLPGGRPAPLTATTFGVGELIRAALDRGVRRVVLGVGGSATTDGGTGMARALGVRFLDADGRDLPPGGAALRRLHTIDMAGLDPRLRAVEVVVASDVDNPLIGHRGAAAVFGPQKGAGPADVEELEQALSQLASVIARQLGVDLAGLAGAGAAGGTPGGAVAFLGASIVSGIDLLLDLAHFPTAVRTARLVITGEGSLDGQSLAGKAPWGVAQAAARAGVPVVALVGRSALADEEARAAGFAEVHALTHLEPDLERCQRDASTLLHVARPAPRPNLAAVSRRRRGGRVR